MNEQFPRVVTKEEAFEACQTRKMCGYSECCIKYNIDLIFNSGKYFFIKKLKNSNKQILFK